MWTRKNVVLLGHTSGTDGEFIQRPEGESHVQLTQNSKMNPFKDEKLLEKLCGDNSMRDKTMNQVGYYRKLMTFD